MTSAGFVLIIFTWMLFHASDTLLEPWHTRLENLAAALGLIGIALVITGVAIWLWHVMP